MVNQFLLRGDTTAGWAATNPVLAARELAVDVDLHRVKIGDGVNSFLSLPWVTMSSTDVTRLEQAASAVEGATTPTDAVMATIASTPGSAFGTGMDARIVAVVEANVPSRAVKAAGLLRAMLSQWMSKPVRLVFAGSSTTEGREATAVSRRYVDLLVGAIQAAYPAVGGVEAPVVVSKTAVWPSIPPEPGIQGFNAGKGGTSAATYLTAAERTRIAAINPSVVLHMVGSNDWSDKITPATYRANLLASLNDLDSKITVPHVHVLVHSWEKNNGIAGVAPWSEYGDVLRRIASERPDSVIFVDTSQSFVAAGVPGTDPLGLIGSDRVHGGDAAHALTADLIRESLGITLSRAVAQGTTPTPVTLVVHTSDGFSGSNTTNIVGRNSDVALGGTAQAWVGDANQFGISSGQAVRSGLATSFVGWQEPSADVELAVKIVALPATGTNLQLNVRRSALSGTPDAYRVLVTASGQVDMLKRVNGATTTLASAAATITGGDTIALRVIGTQVVLLKNDVPVRAVTDTSITAAGFAGLVGGTAADSVLRLDDVVLRKAA